jgi:hypothetical protein
MSRAHTNRTAPVPFHERSFTFGKIVRSPLARVAAPIAAGLLTCSLASAQTFFFSTGNPDGRMGAATHPEGHDQIENETGDDFLLAAHTRINTASFVGLLPANTPITAIEEVIVEIYRVFPFDSDPVRVIHVPTRANSPSDVAFDSRDSDANALTYTASVLSESFTVANSVVTGIHAFPDQLTHGEGPVTGVEVQIQVALTNPLTLTIGHYFFVPQVKLSNGAFLWISAPKPIVAPGTPFVGDLQAWTRDANLDPDWLRIGTDIVGGSPAPTFNMTFSLNGDVGICACDWDFSGAVNSQDFYEFVTDFFNGTADFNGSGATDSQDFFDFLTCFFAGC